MRPSNTTSRARIPVLATVLTLAGALQVARAEVTPAFAIAAQIAGEQRRYSVGERIPLQIVVENRPDRPRTVRYLGGWWWASPSVTVTRDGKPVPVRQTILLGAVPILSKEIPARKSVELPHAGLWIGRAAPKHTGEPTLPNAEPGKYRLTLTSPVLDDPARDGDSPSRTVEFEVGMQVPRR